MIQCKRVYEECAPDDGYRVLADRLWPRGMKKERLVFDEWCKTVAPSGELRNALHTKIIDFSTFSTHYRLELDAHTKETTRLARISKTQTLTLLFSAKEMTFSHVQILADYLRHLPG